MADTKIQITKLNNHNYQVWKFKLELLLSKEDLWTVVCTKPPDPLGDGWQTRDGKARAHIGLSVEDDQLIHIRRLSTAFDMWQALKEYHEKSTLSNKVRLLRRLCRTFLPEGGNMETHLKIMDETMDELTTLGEPLANLLSVAFYLSSLPESYGTLITALESRPETDLTATMVKGKLIEEYTRRNEVIDSCESEKALQVNGSGSTSKFCFFCKKINHIKADCRKFKLWKQKKESKNQASVAEAKNNGDEEICFTVEKQKMFSAAEWCIDSGASAHMCNDEAYFTKISKQPIKSVALADGRSLPIKGIGTVKFKTETNNIRLEGVLLVPDLQCNLLSVGKLTKKGCDVVFIGQQCEITWNGRKLMTINSKNDVYKATYENCAFTMICDGAKCVHEWHRVLGHRNLIDVRRMALLANDMKINKCQHSDICETCLQSKSSRDPFPKESVKKTTEMLDLIHTDLCTIQQLTPGGNKYILTLIDDFTRYTHIYLLKQKSDTASKMIEFIKLMRTQYGKIPKAIRSDRGGEYMDAGLRQFFADEGIKTQLTVPKTPQQNGVAERKNRTIIDMTRCMLASSGLHKKYWGEAVSTAIHILNRLPTKAVVSTPYELWHSRKPNLNYMHQFGASVYAHIPKDQRMKLDDTAKKMVFVGYEEGTKGYRLLDVTTNKIKISRDVKFITEDENRPNKVQINDVIVPAIDTSENDEINVHSNESFENDEKPIVDPESNQSEDVIGEIVGVDDNEVQQRRSNRPNMGVPSRRLIEEINISTTESVSNDPISYDEAIKRPDAQQWKRAMDDEIESLHVHGTWQITKLPPEVNAIGSKWVYKTKTDQDGNIVKYKARLVAQGFSQKYGRDYDEVFAPVANPLTLKVLLVVAGKMNMEVKHFDILTAFLNGDLSHEVYMRQPKGYTIGGKDIVCKLVKNLYGLRQGANEWNKKFNRVMHEKGYKQSNNDACLYTKREGKHIIYILNHVDDIVASATNLNMLDNFESEMNNEFKIKNLGNLRYYLGIQFERKKGGVFYMHQGRYIESKLNEFNLSEAKPSSTPINKGFLKQNTSCELFKSHELYRSAIGSLLYLSTNSRPDISIATSILARRVSEPSECDWNEVKRVFRYIKSTKNLKLRLGDGNNDGCFKCYVDSDWAGDDKDRKSSSGYCFIFNGSLIGWASKKQTTVSLSTTEAEFIAFAEAAREIIWIERILNDFGQVVETPIRVYEDNQGCIKLLQNQSGHQRTKHIDTKYKFARDLITTKKLVAVYCNTEDMIADLLTKPLDGARLAKIVTDIGLVDSIH